MYLIFRPLEVLSRYHDPQLHVAENYSYLFIWAKIFENFDVETHISLPRLILIKQIKNDYSRDQQNEG